VSLSPYIATYPEARQLRVLLTEGASTSAREAVTALALLGHRIEVCDPDWHCLCRFSSLIERFHRCPGIGADPRGYLEFTLGLLGTGRFDVLLPIHEQGLLFAKARLRLPSVGLALPSHESYAAALDKARFSQLLSELGIAQPRTTIVNRLDNPASLPPPPFVLKRPIGTANRGVWMIHNAEDLARAVSEIGGDSLVLVQEMMAGPLEHAQAIFDKGRLVAMHAYRDVARGVGGGAAAKESVARPQVRTDLERIGARLAWHGALSVDYILHQDAPHFIDCNPRLVEPMSAVFAGVDLVDILLRVSLGETPTEAPPSKPGVRTHLALQALLGAAARNRSRAVLFKEIWRLLRRSGLYRGSCEELTPARIDWLSVLPVCLAAVILLASPRAAHVMPAKGWGAGLLTPAAIRIIGEIPS
jgi:predicted ATP-grasp superfamily ATP-dependent carboligase